MRIVLIGPRGCGKTTIGRLLADRLGVAFVDLDDMAAAQFEETSVTAIWQKHGEGAWRAAEVRALRAALAAPEQVSIIALGGGTPVVPEARQMLEQVKARGTRIVYLECPVQTLAQRLAREPGDRPSLSGRAVVEEIEDVLAAREPVYRAMATTVVRADHVAARVVEAIIDNERG